MTNGQSKKVSLEKTVEKLHDRLILKQEYLDKPYTGRSAQDTETYNRLKERAAQSYEGVKKILDSLVVVPKTAPSATPLANPEKSPIQASSSSMKAQASQSQIVQEERAESQTTASTSSARGRRLVGRRGGGAGGPRPIALDEEDSLKRVSPDPQSFFSLAVDSGRGLPPLEGGERKTSGSLLQDPASVGIEEGDELLDQAPSPEVARSTDPLAATPPAAPIAAPNPTVAEPSFFSRHRTVALLGTGVCLGAAVAVQAGLLPMESTVGAIILMAMPLLGYHYPAP